MIQPNYNQKITITHSGETSLADAKLSPVAASYRLGWGNHGWDHDGLGGSKPWLQTVEIKIEFELLRWDSSQKLACRHQIQLDLHAEDYFPHTHEPPSYCVILIEAEQTIVHFHNYLDDSLYKKISKKKVIT